MDGAESARRSPSFRGRRFSHPRWALLSACLATGTMVGFLICTPPALPLIQHDLGASFDELQWIPNAYSLAQAALLVTGGAIGDRIGHRRVYLLGMSGYAVALTLCAIAPDALALVLLGALAGLVSSPALGNALSILAHAFPPQHRAAALAAWGVSVGVAYAAGPLIGGVVAQQLGWRYVFLVLAALAATGALAAARSVGAGVRTADASYDVPGVLLLAGGLVLLLVTLIEGNRLGWESALIACAAAGTLVLLWAFAVWERRTAKPLLDVDLLRDPVLRAAALATLTLSGGFFAMVFYLPIYLVVVLDASPGEAAVQLLGVTGTCLVASLVTLRLRRRIPARWLVIAALLALSVGALLTSRVTVSWGYGSLLPGLAVFGWGLGTINGPLAALVADGGRARLGVANAAVYVCRPVGAALGIAGFGAVLQAQIAASLTLPAGVDRADAAGAVASGAVAREAASLPYRARHAFTTDAQTAFVHGFGRVFLVLAIISALAALLSGLLLRAGRAAPPP